MVHKHWKGVAQGIAWLIVFVFGSLSGAVDFLQKQLPLQIPSQQLAIQIVLIAIGLGGFSAILWNTFWRKRVTSQPATPPILERTLIALEDTEDAKVIRPKATPEWGPLVKDKGGKRTQVVEPEGLPSQRDQKESSNTNRRGISSRSEADFSASESTEEERSLRHSES